MGLLERAGRLGSAGNEAAPSRIASEVERLAGPNAMGHLFKVLAIVPAGIGAPPFPSAS
jgi:SAM-dependent MidA family methyltransferase